MKKWMLVCLVLVLMTGAAMADTARVEMPKLGESMETAVTLKPGVVYYDKEFRSHQNWLKIKADKSGDYTFSVSTEYAYWNGFILYNEFGEKILKSGERTLTISLDVGKTYYLTLKPFLTQQDVRFSYCTPYTHVSKSQYKTIKEATCTGAGQAIVQCESCKREIGQKQLPVTGHVTTQWVVGTPATCVDMGIERNICTACGVTTSSRTIPAAGHKKSSERVITEASCISKGQYGVVCLVCSKALSSKETPMVSHTPDVWMDLREATCTADGVRVQRCTVCNATLNTETVAAYGHSPMEWVTEESNGCLKPGKRVQKCSDCGLTIAEEDLPALVHTWSEWTTDIEATEAQEGRMSRFCTTCGKEEHEALPKVEKFLGIF